MPKTPLPSRARRKILSYRDLDVWRVAARLVVMAYRETKEFPACELYGLTSQIRRAAVSIPANIAEGYGRVHRGEYVKFLAVANGSLKELETEVLIARELGYGSPESARRMLNAADRLGRMLASLIRALRQA